MTQVSLTGLEPTPEREYVSLTALSTLDITNQADL